MTIDIPYEAIEYGKVLLGYLFLMLLMPSVVFYRHLHKKPLVYRFGFCITVVPVCLNALVLVLGLLHILSMRLTALILAAVFVTALIRLAWSNRSSLRALKRPWKLLRVSLPGEDAVYVGLWAAVLLFGAVYFSYGAFQVNCYGYGDLYVHHSWIYGLMEGNAYSGGIYPEAMHCFVYCLKALLGISVFSGLRFLQCIHVVVFLLTLGSLLREMFRWRYMPALVVMLFLTLDVQGVDMITPMSRLQWALPMEFGLPYACVCALFLLRYIKATAGKEAPEGARGLRGGYWKDENLLVFALALIATLSIHYYATIIAFFLCVPVALCAFRKVFHWKRFLPLAAAAVCSVVIAAAPMAWALANGIEFEASINWALTSMSGESAREDQALLESADGQEAAPREEKRTEAGGIFRYGYAKLYGRGRGALLLGLSCLSLAFCAYGKLKKKKWAEGLGYGYIPLLLMSFVYVLTYAMPYMGLPQIIAEGRFSAIGHPLTLAGALIPLDAAGSAAMARYGERLTQRAAVLAAIGVYVLAQLSGNYHGFLYYELSRYPEAVTLARTIMDEYGDENFGIMSTTDEVYQIVEKGTHVELQTFLENVNEEEYRLWLENLFFFVEKKPLYYAQLYFAEGPAWLGVERYPDASREEYETLHPTWRVSQAPDVIASEVSPDKADREIDEPNVWLRYTRLENREILESRAYEQCMRLMETYPDQMKVYFEDENFICFHLEQPRKDPYNLAIPREE